MSEIICCDETTIFTVFFDRDTNWKSYIKKENLGMRERYSSCCRR